jgi:hypothetical protein
MPRRAVNNGLLSDQHTLAALHDQAHRRLVQAADPLAGTRVAVQAQARHRRRMGAVGWCVAQHGIAQFAVAGNALLRRESRLGRVVREGLRSGVHCKRAEVDMGAACPCMRPPTTLLQE